MTDREKIEALTPLVNKLAQSVEAFMRERDRNMRKIADMEEALNECREYFEPKIDADQPPGEMPHANKEMQLLVMIDRAIGRE